MDLYESMNRGFEKKYGLDESKNLNEDFSDQLPTWAQNAIAGSKYNQELKKKLTKQNIDLANAEVEIIDPSALTARGVKTGIDEDGNVLILKMAVGEPYNPYKDNFVYIPGIYNDDYSLTNPRTGKWQQVKYMPAKDVINYVTDAIRISPTSGLSSLRKDRAAAKKKSIDRGEGQYFYTSKYDPDSSGWVRTKGQDKSGYPIPDVTKLYSKLVQLTPDNYEDTFAYADKKLNEVKEAITNLLQNPDVQSNLFKKKFGFFNNNILRELSDLEESAIDASRELEDIKSSVRKAVEKGEADDEFFKWMNSDGFYTLRGFRKHIKEINDNIKELLNKIKPMEESFNKKKINEGYRELKQLNYEELLAKYNEIQDDFFNTYLIPVFEGKIGPLEDGGYVSHEFIKFRDTKEGRKALFREIYTNIDGEREINTIVSLSIPDFLNIIRTKDNMHD